MQCLKYHIPSIIGGIISGGPLTYRHVCQRTIFQAHSSQDSVTFLLTEPKMETIFLFIMSCHFFHLGTAMIDFHSSSILPFLKPLTQTDTMQNAVEILEHTWQF